VVKTAVLIGLRWPASLSECFDGSPGQLGVAQGWIVYLIEPWVEATEIVDVLWQR
jgi:hypothetical protein